MTDSIRDEQVFAVSLDTVQGHDVHAIEIPDDGELVAAGQTIDALLKYVADSKVPIKERGGMYVALRSMRLEIDRALRPITKEITDAMIAAQARQWGPLRIVEKSKDVKYVCNDEGNWGDASVQDTLAGWYHDPSYRPFLKLVPEHLEVDTIALRDGLYNSDPGARTLFDLLKAKRYRTSEGKTKSLTVEEGA